jgi:hypothetical protein
LFARRNRMHSLKMLHSLPSMDKICPVHIRSDSICLLCFENSYSRSTKSFAA